MLGQWDSFDEIEEKLCLAELEAILKAARRREKRQNTFAAALKGIDLDKENGEEGATTFEDVQRRAQAKLTGKSEEELAFAELGFAVEEE